MDSRKRRNVLEKEGINEPRAFAAPNICTLSIEGINPTLDPNRALLRRVFFLNDDHTNFAAWLTIRRKDMQLLWNLEQLKTPLSG
jgi:hypothetical protein